MELQGVVRMMKKYVAGVAAAVVALVVGSVGTALAGTPSGWVPPPPPDDTIVRVEGDAENGFGIHYYDGSSLHPPTDSEARAECDEYDRRVARVRCRTQVRTWYRDLADLRQALEWAHASSG
ncbi:MAG: hypothetical protein ACRDOM_09645 [Nocardioides sp.]